MILKGDLTSINSNTVQKVFTKVDENEVPYFLVVYNSGQMDAISVRIPKISTPVITDSKLCQSINDYYF